MSIVKEYEYIKTEVNGETILIPMRKPSDSVFFKFNELQGIVGNSGGKKYSKSESCYVPARELLKKEQNGPVLTKKKTPPKNTGNK